MSALKQKKHDFDAVQIEATVHDFEAFFTYLDEVNPKLTTKAGQLSNKDLFEINARLVHRKDVEKPTYAQISYPVIHVMFEIAQLGRLYEIVPIGKSSALTLKRTLNLEVFYSLNLYEKYAYLLETLWSRFPFEQDLRYEGRRALDEINRMMVTLASKKPGQPLRSGEAGMGVYGNPWFSVMAKFTNYFSLFGFWTFVENKPSEGRKQLRIEDDVILSITPTNWGVVLAGMLKTCSIRRWREETIGREADLYGDWLMRLGSVSVPGQTHEALVASLKSMFEVAMSQEPKVLPPMVTFLAPLFPEGTMEKTIEVAERAGAGTGLYEFKVSLSRGVWRTIRMSGEETLEALHRAIQNAFDFDDDHLYCFYMNPRGQSSHSRDSTISSPNCNERHSTDEATLNTLNLYIGQRFTYLFDFGAEWTFEIQVKGIEREVDGPETAEMIDSRGEAPLQYGDLWFGFDEFEDAEEEEDEKEE